MFSRSLWADSIILSIMLIDNVMASTAPLCDLRQGHWGAGVKGGDCSAEVGILALIWSVAAGSSLPATRPAATHALPIRPSITS